MTVKHVLISDTHGNNTLLRDLPEGDVLIHCGDVTRYGSRAGLREFAEIYGALPHKTKIMIAGNHDGCFLKHPEEARAIVAGAGIVYLQDEGIKVNGLKYWGIPWTPDFYGWHFMGDEEFLAEKWGSIPEDTDVIISHGPPRSILDAGVGGVSHFDIVSLVLQPQLNVFGHIHEGYGIQTVDETTYINCSLLNDLYQPVNQPIAFDLPAI